MALKEERPAVFKLAVTIMRAISEWRAAELRAIHKAAVTEYKGDPWSGGPRAKEITALYAAYYALSARDTYEAGPLQHAIWSIQTRLVEDFEQVYSQERFQQSNPGGLLDLPEKVSALRENCERVMKVIAETQDSDMRFTLGMRALAVTLKPRWLGVPLFPGTSEGGASLRG